MKTKIVAFSVLLFISNYIIAQDEQVVKTEIENITVYLNGASVLRSQKLNLKVGRNTFKVSGLSTKMDTKSLNLTLSGDAKLVTFYFEKDIVKDKETSTRLNSLADSLKSLEYTHEKLGYELEAFVVEKELLTSNTARIGENNGVKTTELTLATTYYRSKITEINSKILEYQTKIKPIEHRISSIKEKLTSFKNEQNDLQCVNLYFIINSSTATSSQLSLRYFVNDVGWAPKYDLRTQGVGSTIDLDYRAQLFNLTGEDWNNVKLILSTAVPSFTLEKPKMDVWGLSYSYNYAGKVRKSETGDGEGLLNNKMMRKDLSENKTQTNNLVKNELDISDLNVEFPIKEKYTILSDGRPNVIDVNSYKLDASYYYFSIPKVAQEVYLIGKMVGWESLNLLEGKANVYLDGTFVGQSFIDTRYSNDTLEIVLGIDKTVNIQRVKRSDFNQKRMIGLNRRESFMYEINVRNNHKTPIDIEIQDQLPVSQENEISIEQDEISGGDKDELSGRLKWQFKLEPAKTRTLKISFSVKYPRNKFVLIRQSRKAALMSPSDFW
jgi:uncharacterized protein (TIGR02231 family)